MLSFSLKDLFLIVFTWVCLWGFCTWVQCLQSPEEGIRAPEAGVTGDSEPSDVVAENLT